MTGDEQIRELWMAVNDVSGPIADLRDKYMDIQPRIHPRYSQLSDVYRNLNNLEQGLYEFLEFKRPVFGRKPEHEFLLIAQGSLETAKILLTIATEEFDRNHSQFDKPVPSQNDVPLTAARAEQLADLAVQLMEADAGASLAMKMADHEKKKNAPN